MRTSESGEVHSVSWNLFRKLRGLYDEYRGIINIHPGTRMALRIDNCIQNFYGFQLVFTQKQNQ